MKNVTLPALLLAMLLTPGLLLAQQPGALETGYQLPPRAIVDILDAPPPPTAAVSPAAERDGSARSCEHAEDRRPGRADARLAGSRINPKTNGPHSPATILGITFKRIADGVETKVALPPGVRIGSPASRPTGSGSRSR